MKPSEKAWLGILAYEAYAIVKGEGETLSEGLDKFCDHENRFVKYGVKAGLAYTALHLANILPPKLDLFHLATMVHKR